MKKEELIKGRWYLTAGEMFIRFDYLAGRQVWVSEYYNSYKRHTVESGYTLYEIIREATSADALAYPVRDDIPVMLETEARTLSTEERENRS
jgi:uncharacterized protein YbaR (Trm112 family)